MASSTSNANAYVDDYYPSFREFKGGLAKLLSSETVAKLLDFFQYPISLKKEISKDEKYSPLRMVENMEVRGQIKPHEISALLNACNKLNLHREISSVKRLFEEYRVMVGDPLTLMSHCSETIALRKIDSQSVHKCTMAILGNAAMNEFPIPNLRLHRTFRKAKGGDIILQSGLQFPCPSSVQKIVLNSFGENEELTEHEMINLLVCARYSRLLVELQLRYFLLPESIPVALIPPYFMKEYVTVSWISYYEAFHLNTQSGRWKSYLSESELNHQDYVTLERKLKGKAQNTKDTEH